MKRMEELNPRGLFLSPSPRVELSPGEPLMPSEGIPPGSINRIIDRFKRTLYLIRQKVIVPTLFTLLSLPATPTVSTGIE